MSDENDLVKIKVPAGMVVKIDGIPVRLWNSVVVTTHKNNFGLMPTLANRTDVLVGPINQPLDGEKPSEKLSPLYRGNFFVKGMIYFALLAMILLIWWAVIAGGLKL